MIIGSLGFKRPGHWFIGVKMKNTLARKILVLGLMGSLFSPVLANAADWYVGEDAIEGTGVTPDDAADCTDKTTPCATIAAVLGKGTFAAGDNIYLTDGTFSTGSTINVTVDVNIFGGYSDTYNSRNEDPSITTVNLSASQAYVFNVTSGSGVYTTLDGMTIQGSSTTAKVGTSGAWLKLNNIHIKDGSSRGVISNTVRDRLEINNTTMTNQNVTGNGGAISIVSNSRLVLTDSILDNNTASGNGGAIYLPANVQG